MSIVTIIIIVLIASIIVGAIYFTFRSQPKEEQLRRDLADCKSETSRMKQQYEQLLAEANEQANTMEEKLNALIENGTDETIKQQLAEVEKLKKKIKSLQDENEEYEDDLDNLRKKLKNKESDHSKLQDEFDKNLREKKHIQEELDSVADQLQEKTHELDVKIESLIFVQEVLTAKRTTDESVNKLHSKIDNLSDFISGELKDAIASIYPRKDDLADALYGSGLDSWAVTAKKSWIQGKTSIAFVGEFSAGKTSIVNRILSQDDPTIPRLPVSTKATTAIPTYISGGVGTFYQFVTPNNELKSISEATFKRVSKEVLDQVKGVSSLIQYFVMTYKNPHLDQLSILDTPGFNSNDKEDAERTIDVINECDALFWVFDVNAGTVNRSSIDLIKKHLKKPLYVVINKVDTKAASEVDKVEQLISKTLTDAALPVEGFIRFSAKAPLDDMMKPIATVQHSDERENYLNVLSEWVKEFTDDQEKDVKNAKKAADKLLKKCNNLADKHKIAIDNLMYHCEEVSNIPHYEVKLFSKDRYEMSETEYSQMCELLQTIRGSGRNELLKLYVEQMGAIKELQNAWNQYKDERQKWQHMNQCRELLKKKIKELKK